MKLFLVLVCFCIFLSEFIFAQTYFPTAIAGASWTNITRSSTPAENGNTNFYDPYILFTGNDTIIDQRNCISLHQNDYTIDSTTIPNNINRIGYLFEDGVKNIYFLNINHCSGAVNTMLLYDFSKQPGDTITYTTDSEDLIFSYKKLVISTIDSVFVFNTFRKQFHFVGNDEVWIEGIGSVHGFLHPIAGYPLSEDVTNLVCYKVQQTKYFLNPDYSDCFPITVSFISENSSNYSALKINPNPVNNISFIYTNFSLEKKSYYTILNTSGKIIFSGQIQGNKLEINKANFEQGLYLIQITDGSIIYSNKFIIQ